MGSSAMSSGSIRRMSPTCSASALWLTGCSRSAVREITTSGSASVDAFVRTRWLAITLFTARPYVIGSGRLGSRPVRGSVRMLRWRLRHVDVAVEHCLRDQDSPHHHCRARRTVVSYRPAREPLVLTRGFSLPDQPTRDQERDQPGVACVRHDVADRKSVG